MVFAIGSTVCYSTARKLRMTRMGLPDEMVRSRGEVIQDTRTGPVVVWDDGSSSIPDRDDLALLRPPTTHTIIGKMIASGKRFYFQRLRRSAGAGFRRQHGSYTWTPDRHRATILGSADLAVLVDALQKADPEARVYTA